MSCLYSSMQVAVLNCAQQWYLACCWIPSVLYSVFNEQMASTCPIHSVPNRTAINGISHVFSLHYIQLISLLHINLQRGIAPCHEDWAPRRIRGKEARARRRRRLFAHRRTCCWDRTNRDKPLWLPSRPFGCFALCGTDSSVGLCVSM